MYGIMDSSELLELELELRVRVRVRGLGLRAPF
jgi:hypothetical protein